LTGTYGLPPMTGEELSAHILGASRRPDSDQRKLERALGRDNTTKIVRIVRLLAEASLEDGQRDDAWRREWLHRLAGELAELLLGQEDSDPERVGVLERKLARHTVDQIVRIVELLARGRARDLAEFLLEDPDEAPDDRSMLRAKLRQDAQNKLSRLQDVLRSGGQAGDPGWRRSWLEALIRDLRITPVEALNAIERRPLPALEPLVRELDALARSMPAPSPELDGLVAELGAQPRGISWNDLLDVLQRGLQALLDREDVPLSWPDLLAALDRWLTAMQGPLVVRGVIEGIDPADLAQAGWGIIFPYEDPHLPHQVPAIKERLQPLLALRRSQVGRHFRIYEGAEGYRPNETASKFLARHGARVSDPADPEKVPYYLLIVGSPVDIPFHFQYQLDVQYAVGRLDFGGDLEAYANYARSVVAAETGGLDLAPRVTFFGVHNRDDRATQLSADHLVEPLSQQIREQYGDRWQIDTVLREEAKRERLQLLLGAETPALLFAAGHGIEFPKDDPHGRQLRHQGALICQDWPGPKAGRGEIPRDSYLAGEDVGTDADLRGLIAFFFACYSAGTPRFDEYTKQAFLEHHQTIADQPFTAALPSAMLGLPRGALAVVGHVERAWGVSFLGPRRTEQIAVFQSAVERLLKGHPLGSAMEYFNGRYAAVSTELTTVLERAQWEEPDPYEVAEMWTANNDARGYIVIGDPAVRLPQATTAEA
ncbi:MAG: hypothetical protein P8189_17940, partial [Anaerolineae bacterium]